MQLLKALTLVLILSSTMTAQAKNKFYTKGALLTPRPWTETTENTKLVYYGGPVISHVKAVPVFWNSKVNSEIQKVMSDFYGTYVHSKHMDWLSEYNTNLTAVDGRQGTNQYIHRGEAIPSILLKPNLTQSQITDDEIRKEIEMQVDAGVLPKPDSDTLYMIHFPADVQITIEGMYSCFSFGGYHNGYKSEKYGDTFYAVLPDCVFALDTEASVSSATFVASHELIEAVTDAYPTPGSSPAYPQAWNDVGGQEIADICQNGRGKLAGLNGEYTISLEWSNSRNKCYDGEQCRDPDPLFSSL